jgi:endonuclease/exonuclease/phosphatase family metal-dependent hydrolase
MLPVTSARVWPTALAAALGVALLTDVLRVFLPSLLTVFGDAGTTPATTLGGFAALWFVPGMLTVPALRRLRPDLVALGAAAALAAARLVLQGTDGGGPQLYAASAGVAAAVVWLVAVAAAGPPGRPAAAGVTGGIAAAATLHVALRTVDLTWWAGAGPWLALAAAGLALLATTVLATSGGATGRGGYRGVGGYRGSGGERAGSPGLWFAVGPALVLAGIVTASPSRAEAAAGWREHWPSFLILITCCLAVLGCLRARAWTRSPLVPATALVLLLAAATLPRTTEQGVTGLLPGWSVWAQAGAAVALGACLGWAGEGERVSRPRARGGAAAAGMLAFLVLVFGYYAGYDTAIGVPNAAVLLAAAVLVGVASLAGAGSAHTWAPDRTRAARRRQEDLAVAAVTCVALIGALATAAAGFGAATATGAGSYPVRLLSYNVRMGYDLRGRFDPKDLADAVRAQHPDVVVLNEVDRGWMVNGGHDLLELLADDLGMRYVFAPAADEVWGDAVLTRLPVLSTRSQRLSGPDSPTGAVALTVVLSLDSGRQLGVVATHLQPDGGGQIPVAQARLAGRIATGLVARDREVVLAGDFNAEPGSAQLAALGPGLVDALRPARPLPTYPSDRPDQQIDHVFTSPGLLASNIQVPATTASDHRPVAVSLAPR